jgi:hypothetical protein
MQRQSWASRLSRDNTPLKQLKQLIASTLDADPVHGDRHYHALPAPTLHAALCDLCARRLFDMWRQVRRRLGTLIRGALPKRSEWRAIARPRHEGARSAARLVAFGLFAIKSLERRGSKMACFG